MIETTLPTFKCVCKDPITHRLKLDSGSLGFYVLELCDDCYTIDNGEFVVEEELT